MSSLWIWHNETIKNLYEVKVSLSTEQKKIYCFKKKYKFAELIKIIRMENIQHADILKQISQENIQKANDSDIAYSFVATSRFIFYAKVIAILVFFVACCYVLYTHRFKPSNNPVNESSLYTPKYK